MNDIEIEINKIKERNKKVEADKAWEISWARRVIVSLFTYLVIVTFFYVSGLSKPFINSIVPAVAFVISTLTLNFFKNIWLKKYCKKDK